MYAVIAAGVFFTVASVGVYFLYPKIVVKEKDLAEIFVMDEEERSKEPPIISFLKRHKIFAILGGIVIVMILLRLYLIALISVAGIFFMKKYREHELKKEIVTHLPGAVNIIKTATRAGLPLQGAMKNVMEYSSSPKVQEIFKRIYYMSSSMGKPIDKVMAEEARRLNIPEMMFLSSVIETHIEVGGNLVEMLDILESNMRRLLVTREKVSSLLAEGRLSAIVLSIIPLAAVTVLLKMNPKYMKFFLTPEGRTGLLVAVIFYLAGIILTLKMIKVKV